MSRGGSQYYGNYRYPQQDSSHNGSTHKEKKTILLYERENFARREFRDFCTFSGFLVFKYKLNRRGGLLLVAYPTAKVTQNFVISFLQHWMQLEGKSVTRTPLDLFMPEYKEVKFPRRPAHRVGQENPVQCRVRSEK